MAFPVPEGDVWFDGGWIAAADAAIPLADLGLQSGLGVFETIAIRCGRAIDADAHLGRLVESAVHLAVPLPHRDEMAGALHAFAARTPTGFGWCKIIATRGGRFAVFGGPMDPAEEGRAATAILLPWRRSPVDPLAGVKSLNYAPFVLGLEEARRRGADEALWRNTRGHIAEGCASNLFVVQRRRVFTAGPRDGILPGVTRKHALAAIRSLGLAIHEGKLRMERLRHADEAFLTSSLKGVRPLLAVDGRPVGRGTAGPVTTAVSRVVSEARYREAGLDPVSSASEGSP